MEWLRHKGEQMWSWTSDPLASIYLFCFAFGLFFSVSSLVFRFRIGRLHLPVGHRTHAGVGGHHGTVALSQGHAATAIDAHAHAQQRSLGGEPSPLNLSSIAVFLLWFGATGYILHTYFGALAGVSLAAATLVGWLGGAAIYFFMVRVLWRGETALDPENYHVEGAVGRVTSAIHAGGTGEVIYTLDSKRRVDGARSVDGTPIANGVDVAIVRYQAGLVYVCPLTSADERDVSA